MTAYIRAKPMGDFAGGGGIAHLDGTCRICGQQVSRGCDYCNRHKKEGKEAKAKVEGQVRRLCELANRRRVRHLIDVFFEEEAR